MAGLRDSRLLKGRGKGVGEDRIWQPQGQASFSNEPGWGSELEVCDGSLPYERSSGKLRFIVRFRKFINF